jgi:hypothetical protein
VKSLVNYLTQDYTFNQLTRLERAVAHFINGKINKEAFIKALILPIEQGGVEMPEPKAKQMAKRSEIMIHQADDIRRFRAKKDNPGVFFDQHKLAERLKDHILHIYRIKMSKEMDENLTELIADRVTGVVEEDEFNARLMLGVRQHGLALSEVEADEVTRYFEKLIAQGVDVSYKS